MGRAGLAFCALMAAAVQAQSPPSTGTPTPSASFGTSATPSASGTPLPIGAFKEILVVDCNGGVHLLPGTPYEINLNLRGLRHFLNAGADEIRDSAKCLSRQRGCPQLTDNDIAMHFVPGMPMLLNWLQPVARREKLPADCMTHKAGTARDGKPAFAQTFFDDTAMSTFLADIFNITVLPISVYAGDTCTLAGYMSGKGCRFQFDEPISKTKLQVGIDECPASSVPYMSVSCKGPWCSNFMRPCGKTVTNDCGLDGLVCRELFPGLIARTNTDQLTDWLMQWKIVNTVAELAGYGGELDANRARLALARDIRTRLYSYWNITRDEPLVSNLDEVTFCLPTEPDIAAIRTRFERLMGERVDRDLSSAAASCAASGCDVRQVGNGICDLVCYNEACKWDGNDCQGPAIDVANNERPDPNALINAGTSRASCMLRDDDIRNNLPPSLPTPGPSWQYNYWEECNGVGTCVTAGVGVQPTCLCPASCQNGALPNYQSGFTPPDANAFNPLNNGKKCMYCGPPKKPCAIAGTCNYVASEYVGIADRIEAWDGGMWDGTYVFNPDRKSGLNFTTPSAVFDVAVGGQARPILQHSCAGELGVNLVSQNLQAAIHAPYLQDAVAFIAERVRVIQDVRQRALASKGAAAITPTQIEIRYMFHHMAHWLYQLTSFTVGGSYPVTLQEVGAGGQSGSTGSNNAFGPNLLSDGSIFTDLLQMPWARREPVNVLATPTPGTDWRRISDWAKAARFTEFSGECTLFGTATVGIDNAYVAAASPRPGADRRCRVRWDGLKYLFGGPSANFDLTVWVDVQQDRCTGSLTGATTYNPVTGRPGPQTLTLGQGAYGLPAFSLFVEGAMGPLAQITRTCDSPSDCGGVPGLTPDCVDVDYKLLALSSLFNERNVNPFGRFTVGGYNTGQECSTSQTLRASTRTIIRGISGQGRDGGAAPRFCMYSMGQLSRFNANGNDATYLYYDDPRNVDGRGTCLSRNYSDGSRMCIYADVQPTVSPNNFRVVGAPARINALSSHNLLLAPSVASVGVAQWMGPGLNRATTSGFRRLGFTISIPSLTPAQFTNNWKERLRWGIAQALSAYGVPVPTEAVFIVSVRDNGMAFTPLPGGGRAGVTVGFDVEVPTDDLARNLTAQLTSNAPGTLSAQAGPVLTRLGLVPVLLQRDIVFREAVPVYPPDAGLSGGAVFGVLLLLAILLCAGSYALHIFYLKPRGKRVPLVPSPAAISGAVMSVVRIVRPAAGGPVARPKSAQIKAEADKEKESAGVVKKANPMAASTAATTAGAAVSNPVAAMAKPAGATAPSVAAGTGATAAAAATAEEGGAPTAAGGSSLRVEMAPVAVDAVAHAAATTTAPGSAAGSLKVVPNPLSAAAGAGSMPPPPPPVGLGAASSSGISRAGSAAPLPPLAGGGSRIASRVGSLDAAAAAGGSVLTSQGSAAPVDAGAEEWRQHSHAALAAGGAAAHPAAAPHVVPVFSATTADSAPSAADPAFDAAQQPPPQ